MKNMKNDKAVSPVIGVILMVVITVIIAAILAVFAFGIGAPAKAPETKLKYTADAATDTFSIYHDGGDSIVTTDERITISYANNNTIATFTTAGPIKIDSVPLNDFTQNATLTPGHVYSNTTMTGITSSGILRVVILDGPTGQVVSDVKVTVS